MLFALLLGAVKGAQAAVAGEDEVFVHTSNTTHSLPLSRPALERARRPFLYGGGTHRAISLTFAPGQESTSGSPSVTSTVCS